MRAKNKLNDGKRWLIPICIFIAQMFTVVQSEELAGNLHTQVVVGQTEVMPQLSAKRVAIGDENILDVHVLRNPEQLLLIGKQAGKTDLRVWTRDGKQHRYAITVIDEPLPEKLQSVQKELEGLEGIRARISGGRVVIEGRALTEHDSYRVAEAARVLGAHDMTVKANVAQRPMIMMDVKVMEIRRNDLKEIGINWESITSGPSFGYIGDWVGNPFFRINNPGNVPFEGGVPVGGTGSNSYLGVTSGLTSTLNLLAQKGFAKFLAEPKLTCRSGGQARFLAGGEVPIPVTDRDGRISVEFKEFGIRLLMAPVADASGFISTTVEVEVSTIDPAIVVLDIPGFSTRKTATEMNVRSGQAMVISGLVSNESSKSVSKLPGLGNIPILGELFKSRQFQTKESELVVFVTPHLTHPGDSRNQNLIRRSEELSQLADENLGFQLIKD